jgi:hypothetical protein
LHRLHYLGLIKLSVSSPDLSFFLSFFLSSPSLARQTKSILIITDLTSPPQLVFGVYSLRSIEIILPSQ